MSSSHSNSSSTTDEFVRSMTFASTASSTGGRGMMLLPCGCEECGPSYSRDEMIPLAIRTAVHEHRLRKRKIERLYVRQNRELVKREDGFSLWRLDLPLALDGGGDPIIVEYRNNHRILFIQQLSKAASVYSIGKGIIGSAAEEGSRQRVDWKEGCAYLLPQCQGIACGWMQKLADGNNARAEGALEENPAHDADIADVVLYSLKVSPDTVSNWSHEGCDVPVNASGWVRKSYELFRRCLANDVLSKRDDIDKTNNEYSISGIELSHEESKSMSVIIELAAGYTT